MHTSSWLPGAISLLGAVAVRACAECQADVVFPPAPMCTASNGAVCQAEIQVIEVVVGKAKHHHCGVCADRHHDDCGHCVTVVGPCPTNIVNPTTTTIINNGVTTVIIQTPTIAPVPASTAASASASVSASGTVSVAASSSAATPTSSLSPLACNNAYIVNDAALYEVDLVSGNTVSTVSQQAAGAGANAIVGLGFNPRDNFLYAVAPTSKTTFQIVKIGSNGHEFIGSALPFPYSVGDFDINGQLWLASGDNTQWAQVDLNPGSTTYGQVANSGTMTPASKAISDWAYTTRTAMFYGLAVMDNGQTQAIQWDPTTKQFTEAVGLGAIAYTGGNPPKWGPAFSDGEQIAVADTVSGQIWKFTPNARAVIESQLGTTSVITNDFYVNGARCMFAPDV